MKKSFPKFLEGGEGGVHALPHFLVEEDLCFFDFNDVDWKRARHNVLLFCIALSVIQSRRVTNFVEHQKSCSLVLAVCIHVFGTFYLLQYSSGVLKVSLVSRLLSDVFFQDHKDSKSVRG